MIELNTFILYEYDENNEEHNKTWDTLLKDPNFILFLGNDFGTNIKKATDEYSNIYIVYKEGIPIGMSSLYYLDNKYEVCYAIIPEYRSKGLATLLLDEFTNYIFNNTSINDLYLYINDDNNKSIRVANKCGYNKTNNLEYKKSK